MNDTGMFCFQCEQTAGGKGCTRAGVCGKQPDTAARQDTLTRELIALARAADGAATDRRVDEIVMRGLFATVTNVNFDNQALDAMIAATREVAAYLGDRRGGDGIVLFQGDPDVVSLRSTLLFGLRGMAAYAWHAHILGRDDTEVTGWLYKGLAALAADHSTDAWLDLIMELGRVNLRCMELLDRAHTNTYGHPVPVSVSTGREQGPFIVITGHDLHDLKQLLEQSEETGVNVYTHGEMLPAHGYPLLKKHAHLKGHYGTAWQNQQKEFEQLPGAVLYTTNCLMPPKPVYIDRLFTTAMVGWPGVRHIPDGPAGRKDFTPVIEKAQSLRGWVQTTAGKPLTTGFGHNAVLSLADQLVAAIETGAVKHVFLVGGCDGARAGRDYYTEFVEKTPPDTLVLTLACGKFRFNHLDLGHVGPFPRLLDMGQCNDAYSAIKVATDLARVFNCGVNDLPLSLVLSWYEQKAVCILLTLLSLGVKNIRLGPTLPAFLSPAVMKVLAERHGIRPVTTAEADMKAILGAARRPR